MTRRIKLMADYFCSPVWHDATGEDLPDPEIGPIDLDDLPVTDDLRDDLEAWADRFDATMDPDDPAAAAFQPPDSLARFATDGAALAARLQAELGRGWVVRYVAPAGAELR
jgi:hypothetical protein